MKNVIPNRLYFEEWSREMSSIYGTPGTLKRDKRTLRRMTLFVIGGEGQRRSLGFH